MKCGEVKGGEVKGGGVRGDGSEEHRGVEAEPPSLLLLEVNIRLLLV